MLRGTSYSIPVGMVLKPCYCSKCGAKLQKEKTHRVVTKEDRDYYQYHKYGTLPQRDYNVYDHRWKCPSCQSGISFDEQRIIDRIQRKKHSKVLLPSEIKEHYKECKRIAHNRVLAGNIVLSLVVEALICILFYFVRTDRTPSAVGFVALFFAVTGGLTVIGAVKRHNGTYKMKIKRGYSYEKKAQLEKLHTYSSHNRYLVDISEQCTCFYCKHTIDSREITEYADNGQTAVCPKCGIDALIPDSIEEPLDENTVAEMHEYWF